MPKVSELTTASTLNTADLLPIVQSGTTKRSTAGAIIDTMPGFTQSGTGASARTLQDKLREFVSAADFGAVGDGGTTDNTTLIQAALDTGKDVFIPPASGYYKVTAALTLTDNQRIFGEGVRSYIRQTTANANVLSATSKTGVVVESLKLYAPGTFTNYNTGAGVLLSSCSKSRVAGVLVENHRGAGVCLYNTNDSVVESNTFINSPVTDLQTNDFSFADIAVVYSSSRNAIVGNICISGQGTGIQIQSVDSGNECHDNLVVCNVVKDCKAYGIIAYRNDDSAPITQTVRGTVISGNSIINTTGTIQALATSNYPFGAAIYIQGAEESAITGNTIRGTHAGAVTFVELLAPGAIGATNLTRCTISGNVIEDAKQWGIYVADPNGLGESIGGAVVSGNTISNSTKGGIIVKRRGRVNIFGNTIDTTGDSGIEIDNVALKENISVVGNQVRNVTGSGAIEVKFADGAVVTANQVDTASVHGITAADSTAIIVSGNIIKDHVTRGVQITSTCSASVVSDNSIIGTGTSTEGCRFDSAVFYDNNRVAGCTTNFVGSFTPWATLTVDSATPSVLDGREFLCTNTVPTTITNFTNGVDGQEINVVFTNGNTTLDFSASNLKGNAGVDRAMAANDSIRAVYQSSASAWFVTISAAS